MIDDSFEELLARSRVIAVELVELTERQEALWREFRSITVQLKARERLGWDKTDESTEGD